MSVVATALLFAAPVASHAVDLDFNGAVSNGVSLAQTYGDGPTWDVTYRDLTTPSSSLLGWTTGYQGTRDVLYSGTSDANSHGRITIAPYAGYQVTLNSFDLTPYLPNNPLGFSSQWAVYAAGGTPSFASVGPLTTLTTFSPALSSTTGVVIEWKTSAYDMGIDNIRFTVTAVPEPETYALLLAGLGVVGAIARRKKPAA
ncbi:MAG: PEP-CTERM sorting domain-containing protein [Rhodoferax sp.]|uniref:PEP-CTERM sorting domain-containing protein n=1 Tax=Rhodoferax sp. TaxID=50421 RepID=UPI002ACEAAD9|nr:PEP-CTERM sorting domain-containing protein [Rhodoferax sp.]MDZ7890646.1 PEP-CTERM sorting domain-containing protein [Rhodoferax sp.]